MNKNISNFYDKIDQFQKDMMVKYPTNTNKRIWSRNVLPVVEKHISSLSKKDLIAFISDKHWNRYPTYSSLYLQGKCIKKCLYDCFSKISSNLMITDDSYKKIFIDHSSGIFRYIVLRSCMGNDKIKAAKIGIFSNDVRVRKASAQIVPVSFLEKHALRYDESNFSVFKIICTRLGYENLSDVFKRKIENKTHHPYSFSFYHFKAFENSSLDEITEIISKLDKDDPQYNEKMRNFQKLISYKVDHTTAPFFINIFDSTNVDSISKDIFMKKLLGEKS